MTWNAAAANGWNFLRRAQATVRVPPHQDPHLHLYPHPGDEDTDYESETCERVA